MMSEKTEAEEYVQKKVHIWWCMLSLETHKCRKSQVQYAITKQAGEFEYLDVYFFMLTQHLRD